MRPSRPPVPPQPQNPAPPAYGPPPSYGPPPAPPVWREAPAAAQVVARLHCPKCHGELVTYERQGVHLEQCRDCRGIWLDRGELDRLIDAEASSVEAPAYQPTASESTGRDRRDDDRRRSWSDDDDDDDDRRRSRDYDDDDRGRRPSRRRSMFGELFEGLIE